jgi:hypothetical protein
VIERTFDTDQGRLPKELAEAGITDMDAANCYLDEVYMPNHNSKFALPSLEASTAFAPCIGTRLPDLRCGCIAMWMERWRYFTARAKSPPMTPKQTGSLRR